MQATLKNTCRDLLTELRLIKPGESVVAYPLTGGVASDIAMVKIGDRKLCVKFALPKLKVKEDWFAPVHRNAAEYAWLEVVANVAPTSAIKLLGQSQKLHGFAMEFIEGDDTYLWKNALLSEAPDQGEAAMVGDLIGRVHVASTHSEFNGQVFQNGDDFHALRIEPYLLHTASIHNDIAASLEQIATQLYSNRQVLSHGDVSPKNIFFRSSGPVILDAECATMGDACFDPSYCLNHLVLKATHLPRSREKYLASALQLWLAYKPFVTWEPVHDIESRICRLLPALMLARVDGKSPVEYLLANEQTVVRSIARRFIIKPVNRIDELLLSVDQSLREVLN